MNPSGAASEGPGGGGEDAERREEVGGVGGGLTQLLHRPVCRGRC